MIKLDAIINDKKLLASIQKGVDSFNRSRSGKAKLNLKIDERGFRQPLGRITGDLDKFEGALAASNARVIAFGASTAVIGGVSKAFKSLLVTTEKVGKQFADINRILGASNRQFEEFSGRLFDIGKKTATTFDEASKAALEFARQGLSMNETLRRTSDALTLVRLTGVNADKAVSALTATVNAFQQSSLTTTEALNKFIAVETKYAVSARDLMEGLGRVGSAAVDAKVSFDELNAMIAAVQQQTGRGGAVIGNAMKTIFTRLQRRDTLEALESYNVAVRDIDGNTRPAMAILQDFAKTYKTLSDANKAYLREQVAGVFQANILSAIVKDLNSDMQVYSRSLTTSTSATNEAAMANVKLNQTLSAMISQTGTELIRLQENVGKMTLEPIAKALIGPFKSILGDINDLLDGEGLGSDLANGFLKGLRNILAGPGLVAAVAVIGTTIIKTLTYITKALPTLVGITSETQKRANIEASINAMLSTDAALVKQIAAAEGNAAMQAGILLGAAQKAETSFAASALATGRMAANLASAGMVTNKMGAIVPGKGGRRGAGGYIPGVAGEMHDIQRGVGGVSASARPVHIPNFAFGGGQHGSMIANTGEHIVPNFRGGGSAVFNPAMVRANGGLPQGAKKITAAQGYVPNFAPLIAQPAMYQKGLTTLRGGSLSGVNTQADTLERMGHPDLARKLRAGVAAKKTQRGKGEAKTKNVYSIPAKTVGVGAIVGMKSRSGPYSPRQSFNTILGREGAVKHDPTLRKYMMANKHKSVQITDIPVGGLSTLGKKGDADQRLKQAFTKKLNKFMLPALNNYSGNIFKSLLKDDGQNFIKDLQNNRQRVFSTSVEGGIFESALQLASRNAKNFNGDDVARFDFEESGRISPMLKKTFFSKKPGVRRADAKRSDSPPNILTLIGKSFGTPATSKVIKSYMAGDIAAWEKTQTAQKGKGARGAGGYVPNFAGRGLPVNLTPHLSKAMLTKKEMSKSGLGKGMMVGKNMIDKLQKARYTILAKAGQSKIAQTLNWLVRHFVTGAAVGLPASAAIPGAIAKFGVPAVRSVTQIMRNVKGGKGALTGINLKTPMGETLAKGGLSTFASGYIPNFAGGGLGAAISREKASGVPSSAIRINSDPRLTSSQNPAGLAVTNQFDEPRGLRDVPNFADPLAAQSHVGLRTTIAGLRGAPSAGLIGTKAMAGVQTAAQKFAMALANGTMTQEQVTRSLNKMGTRAKMSTTTLAQLNTSVTTAAADMKTLSKKVKTTPVVSGPRGAGSGMGGMALMMGAPMLGGMIEQGVGGQAGSAISGAMTGGVMGGVMGGMLAGAGGGTMVTPVIGTAIGATLGLAGGVIAAFSASSETASAALGTFATKLESTGKAADSFIMAQKAMVSAETVEDFDKALITASSALYAIDDPELRKNLKENATEFDKLTEIVKRYRVEQTRELLLKKAANVIEEKLNSDVVDERKEFSDKDPKVRAAAETQLGREVLGPIVEFLRRSGKDQGLTNSELIQQALQVSNAIKVGRTDQEGLGGRAMRLGQGLYDETAIYDKLMGIGQGGVIGKGPRAGEERGSLEASTASDIAKIFGSQLDPGIKSGTGAAGTEKTLFTIGEKLMALVMQEQLDMVRSLTKSGSEAQKEKANYTKALNELFTSIDDAVLDRADRARKTKTNLARRSARLSARGSLLGKARDPLDLATERRGETLENISIKKTLVDSEVISANAKKLQTIIDKVGDGAQSVLTRLKKTVSSRFLSGDFTGAMEGLMDETTKTGGTFQGKNVGGGLRLNSNIIKSIADFNRSLGAELSKRQANLTKEEKLVLDRFREDQVRAELLTAERDITLQKTKYLAALEVSLAREEAANSGRMTTIDQRLRDPRETRFMRSGARLNFQRGLEREKLTGGQDMERGRLQLSIQQRNAEIIASQLTTKSTLNLVAVNLKLITALDDNTVAKGGTPSTGGGGVPPVTVAGGGPVDAEGWPMSRADQKAAYIEGRMSPAVRRGSEDQIERARGLFGRDFEKKHPLGDTRGVRGLNVGDYREKEITHLKAMITRDQAVSPEQKATMRTRQELLRSLLADQAGGAAKKLEQEQGVKVGRNTSTEALRNYWDSPEGKAAAKKLEQEHGPDKVKVLPGQKIEIPTAAKLTKYKSEDADFTQRILADSEGIQASLNQQVKIQDVLNGKKETQLNIGHTQQRENFDSDTGAASNLLDSEKKFSEGLKTGMGAVWTDSEGIFNRLGNDLPLQFRNNMVGAIEAAMDKTSSLGDALDGVALAFLGAMRQAFLQSAVSNMMNVGSTIFGLDPKQRGGSIRAQNGLFVGGNSTGDKHPALLESGEYVLNRNAVGALGGPDALNSINFGMAPRFQKGGGHQMSLSEKIPSSRFSGLFLQNSNPEYDEYADAAVEKQQAAMAKHQKKEQKKAMILSTIISGVMAAGMGALSKGASKWNTTSKWGSNRVGDPAGWSTMNKVFGQKPEFPGSQRGGFIGRQSGGSIGSSIARRYGSFQGGGTVPVASGAPSLGGSTNTNNISINIGLGGDNESRGSGASQTATGNTGAPSKANTSDAKALSEKIKSQVLKILTEEQRVGGTLSPSARRP